MDNRNYSEIMETLRKSYEAIQPDKIAEFTKDLEKVLGKLICRNVREDVPAVIACPHCHVCDNVKFGRTESEKNSDIPFWNTFVESSEMNTFLLTYWLLCQKRMHRYYKHHCLFD